MPFDFQRQPISLQFYDYYYGQQLLIQDKSGEAFSVRRRVAAMSAFANAATPGETITAPADRRTPKPAAALQPTASRSQNGIRKFPKKVTELSIEKPWPLCYFANWNQDYELIPARSVIISSKLLVTGFQ